MTPERRQDDHPHPPPGTLDRRVCSDAECMAARGEWIKQDILPEIARMIERSEGKIWAKMLIQVATMIGGTVVFCSAVFLYLSQNAIRDYDLVARDRYTTAVQHQVDMARIEGKITTLEVSVSGHLTDVRKAIDRNLTAIQSIVERKR